MKKHSLCSLIFYSVLYVFISASEPVVSLALAEENGLEKNSSAYQPISLGVLEGNSSEAMDINDKGQIVGLAYQGRNGPYRHAFLWEKNKMIDLGSFLGTQSSANAINKKGEIVGEADDIAFFLKNKIKTVIGTLGEDYRSYAVDINDDGQVVGDSFKTDGSSRAFFWDKEEQSLINIGTLGGLNASANMINENGQVIGQSDDKNGYTRGFIWQNGKIRDLGTLGGNNTYVAFINNNGQIVGKSETKEGYFHGFLWQHGKMTDLGTFGGSNSEATGINDDGVIVGIADSIDGFFPFIWENKKLVKLSSFNATNSAQPFFINEKGHVIGIFRSSQFSRWHVFLSKNDEYIDLGGLGFLTFAVKINKKDVIIGNGKSHVGNFGEAFVFMKNKDLSLSE